MDIVQNSQYSFPQSVKTQVQDNKQVPNNIISENKSESKLEKVSFIILLISIILSPLAFTTTNYTPVDTIKATIIVFGILISCILYFIASFNKKTVSIPKHPLIITGGLIIISTIISTFLSTNVPKSFIGQGFELGTASFLILMFISSFLISRMVYNNKDRLLSVYGSFLLSFLILALFHIMRLFTDPSFLSFGLFNSATSTLIGKWYDLGIFAGIIFLLSFFALRLLSVKKGIKSLLYVLFVLSGLMVIIVNLNILWFIIAMVFLGYGIYGYIIKTGNGTGIGKVFSKISYFTLILFILSAVLAWKGNVIVAPLVNSLKIQQTEIALPWQLTLDVTANTIKSKPLFGAGPNRFGTEFLLYKPAELNPSPFWAVEFNTAFGLLPSFITTYGVVGTILWILFFIFFFSLGIKALKKVKEEFGRFALISSFFTSSFLWILFFTYSPSHVIIFFTFIITGLFIGLASSEMIISTNNYGSIANSTSRKIAFIIIMFAVIISALWTLIYIKKFIALSYFQSGISSLNLPKGEGIDKAELSFKKALSWDKSDIYYQALSEVDIAKITAIAQTLQEQSAKDPKTVDQELVKKAGALIEEAIAYTRSAISVDPTNYYNHLAEARISEIAMSFQVKNAYENAKTAYANALMFNPYNPSLYLSLAKVEASQKKYDEAKRFIGGALQLKQNYIDAIFLLSQIQVTEGQIKDAITSVQVATQINPNDPTLFFQLGLLYYNDKDYSNATSSLQRAIDLNPQYANAKYFLGLSLARLNKNTEAIAQFEDLVKANPESQELTFILSNLKAGKSPFTDVKPPLDNKPEKRSTLPVKETVNKR